MKYSNIQKQIILGSILGDGCITLKKRKFKRKKGIVLSESLAFIEGHTLPQEEYLLWKNNILKFSLCRHKNIITISKESKDNKFFKKIREEIYVNGKKKKVNSQIVDELDELGLLVWYLDDGTITYPSLMFCTDSFYHYSQIKLIGMLKNKFGVKSKLKKITNYNRRKDTKKDAYRIVINAENIPKLIKILKRTFDKYNLPDCMKYKVDLEYQISKFKKRNRKYYIENKESIKKSQKVYLEKNRDKISKWKKKYRLLNRKELLRKSIINWDKNKDRYNLNRRIKMNNLRNKNQED